jgi:hypothetical protein
MSPVQLSAEIKKGDKVILVDSPKRLAQVWTKEVSGKKAAVGGKKASSEFHLSLPTA